MNVLFQTGEKYYRGIIKYKEYEKLNLNTIESFDFERNKWIASGKNSVSIY